MADWDVAAAHWKRSSVLSMLPVVEVVTALLVLNRMGEGRVSKEKLLPSGTLGPVLRIFFAVLMRSTKDFPTIFRGVQVAVPPPLSVCTFLALLTVQLNPRGFTGCESDPAATAVHSTPRPRRDAFAGRTMFRFSGRRRKRRAHTFVFWNAHASDIGSGIINATVSYESKRLASCRRSSEYLRCGKILSSAPSSHQTCDNAPFVPRHKSNAKPDRYF